MRSLEIRRKKFVICVPTFKVIQAHRKRHESMVSRSISETHDDFGRKTKILPTLVFIAPVKALTI